MTKSGILCLALLLLAYSAKSKVVQHTFRISYISGSPDGVKTNTILGINGRFPGPVIEAEVNDIIQVTVINEIKDEQTGHEQNVTIHWHGIHQRGTPFEDGPSQITQCPIKYGSHQIYTFPVPIPGTYWYHSHVNSQYTEGLWGVLIIRGKPEVWGGYEEILITLNDWYHASAEENEAYLLSPRSRGGPPLPSSALMNGMGRYPCEYAEKAGRKCSESLQRRPVFYVEPGKTYKLRLVSTSGWTAFNFTINGHALRPVEIDGVDTVLGSAVQAVHIGPGQRYAFLLSIPRRGRLGDRFLIRARTRQDLIFNGTATNINPYPEAIIPEVTGILEYRNGGNIRETSEQFDHTQGYIVTNAEAYNNLQFVQELGLTPFDKTPAPAQFDISFQFNITFRPDNDGIVRGSFNDRPAELALGMPQLAKMIHGVAMPEQAYPVYIRYDQLVQVVVYNPGEGSHPIHLHGHHFWVMGMGRSNEGNYDSNKHVLSTNGMRRDTVMIKPKSWLVLKFKADNVGVWTMHCHIDWHVRMGMFMTFVEAPERSRTLRIPEEARRVCADHNVTI